MKRVFALIVVCACMAGCQFRGIEDIATGPSDWTEVTAATEDAFSRETQPEQTGTATETLAPTQAATETLAPTQAPTQPEEKKRLIVIDAGHQRKSNKDKEPVGPGAEEMKTKVSSGTSGCVSGLDEYELNLTVALLLQQELENRGYEVLMIRTGHDVDISNVQRAQIANQANADAVIRIHANSADNADAHGALTICQTRNNPYQPQLYEKNRALAQCVIDAFCQTTGCYDRGVWETDTMTGLNWCEVPNCFIELGFMSNPQEDARMATEEYQRLMVQGIADGLDKFFE